MAVDSRTATALIARVMIRSVGLQMHKLKNLLKLITVHVNN